MRLLHAEYLAVLNMILRLKQRASLSLFSFCYCGNFYLAIGQNLLSAQIVHDVKVYAKGEKSVMVELSNKGKSTTDISRIFYI